MRPIELTPLFASLQSLTGIGPRLILLMRKCVNLPAGITEPRVLDLLWHLPNGVIDRRAEPAIAEAVPGSIATLKVRILKHHPPPRGNNRAPYKVRVEDETGKLDGSVVKNVEKLLGCCVPTEESRGQKRGLPPLVVFQWGPIVGFPAFITSVTAKYTLFDSTGAPLRATCTVALEELAGDMKGQNPTSGALAAHRSHTVIAGDSLASLAYREYGDPGLWRALAAYNRIDDPMRVRTATELLLPASEDLLERQE